MKRTRLRLAHRCSGCATTSAST